MLALFRLTLDEKYALCRSLAEECIQENELLALLEKKPNPVAYDGFEPSGRMHIAQGVLKALNVNKLTKSGVTFKFWCAKRLGMSHLTVSCKLAYNRVVVCPWCAADHECCLALAGEAAGSYESDQLPMCIDCFQPEAQCYNINLRKMQ